MKKLILVIFVLLLLASKAISITNDWQAIPSPVSTTIYSISFINDYIGFIGLENSIYKTTNKGKSWYQVYSGNLLIHKFSFFRSSGYAACNDLSTGGGALLITNNAGETWTQSDLVNNDGFVDLYMKSANEIYVAGFDGYCAVTTNSGKFWSQEQVTPGILVGLNAVNGNLFGLNPVNLYKRDQFGYWYPQGYIGIYSYGGLFVDPNDNSIYAGGDNWESTSAAITKTENEGQKWDVKLLGDKGEVRGMIFCKNYPEDSYAVGEIIKNNVPYACIWQKISGNWTKVYVSSPPTGNSLGFMQLCETSSYVYTAGGYGKILRKVKTSNVSQEEALINLIPAKYSLSQNYPNPFNPITKITYTLKNKVDVKIVIYNLIGKEMMTLVDENQSSGSHEITFNASDLPSGPYFYKLTAGSFVSVRKMMLIK